MRVIVEISIETDQKTESSTITAGLAYVETWKTIMTKEDIRLISIGLEKGIKNDR